MIKNKIIFLGQMVLDTVVYGSLKNMTNKATKTYQNRITLGGPPSFSLITISTLSKLFHWIDIPLVYAYACPKGISLLNKFSISEEVLKNVIIRPQCPHFQLEYNNLDLDRKIFLKNPPLRYNPTVFKWNLEQPPIAIVGSVYQEFDNYNIFQFLSKRCSFIAFDPQGCFRQITTGGKIVFRHWFDVKTISKIDCLKISEEESKFLKLGTSPIQIIERLLDLNLKTVLITKGKNGAILGTKKNGTEAISVYNVPAYSKGIIVDETGAGDVFLSSYVTHFTTFGNELEAVAFATSIASLLIEDHSLLGKFSREEILHRKRDVQANISEM